MSEQAADSPNNETLPCRRCDHHISVTAKTCSTCGATIITTVRAKIMMGLGGLFTLSLVYAAAKATLDPAISGFTAGFFFYSRDV